MIKKIKTWYFNRVFNKAILEVLMDESPIAYVKLYARYEYNPDYWIERYFEEKKNPSVLYSLEAEIVGKVLERTGLKLVEKNDRH